jgi:hypothetical protein
MSKDTSTDAAVKRWFEWWAEHGIPAKINRKTICMAMGIKETSWYGVPKRNITRCFEMAVLDEEKGE